MLAFGLCPDLIVHSTVQYDDTSVRRATHLSSCVSSWTSSVLLTKLLLNQLFNSNQAFSFSSNEGIQNGCGNRDGNLPLNHKLRILIKGDIWFFSFFSSSMLYRFFVFVKSLQSYKVYVCITRGYIWKFIYFFHLQISNILIDTLRMKRLVILKNMDSYGDGDVEWGDHGRSLDSKQVLLRDFWWTTKLETEFQVYTIHLRELGDFHSNFWPSSPPSSSICCSVFSVSCLPPCSWCMLLWHEGPEWPCSFFNVPLLPVLSSRALCNQRSPPLLCLSQHASVRHGVVLTQCPLLC